MTEKTAGAELIIPSDTELEQAIAAIMDGTPLPGAPVDAEAVSRGILERILQAGTYEEIFRPQSLDAWRDHKGRPAEVNGLHLNQSTYEASEGGVTSAVYAVVDVTWLDDGEVGTVTCGGRNVLMQLVQALRKGLIPGAKVKLVGNRTGEGYEALWLESV